ncbi:MAG: sensor histidine kinase [Aeromicrobium sp.]|uniref:sensor histidine kinase n=1 Tax=Aeromicrobium sp. TaxID=1871063 RepID=UPI002608E97C|nr:sensor histidine kinase [Aeromicrobium sp.]MDF1703491.1 sensor histidine kinase [Aeromicrobium sp.]
MTWLTRDWQRPLPTARLLRNDLVLGAVLALLAVASLAVFRSAAGVAAPEHGNESYLWFALAGALLGLRRRLPLAVLLLESVIFVVIGERFADLAVVFTIQMVLFAALYAAWAWSRTPKALYVTTAVVLVGMFGWLAWSFTRPGMLPGDGDAGFLLPRDTAAIIYTLAVNVVYFFGAIAWGQAAWMSARRRALLEAQFERERGHQAVERRQAVQAERVRIARDLHDVVAHHVSSIGIQATGARRILDRDPARAADALATIEASSRQAVAQMHQLVGLLREGDEDATREPQPGLCEVLSLADPHGRPRVEVEVVGERTDVDATVSLNLFRIAQEAVTNARRHAQATRVLVTLRYLDDAVEVEIVDDGHGSPEDPPVRSDDGGFGLAGIRERVAMLGAHHEIGNRPNGGFRVRVRAPRAAG